MPCDVLAWSSTMERPAVRAAAGTAFCNPGRVDTEAAPSVSAAPPVEGGSEAGERRTSKTATATTAAEPHEEHEGARGDACPRGGSGGRAGSGARSDLARMAPEPVVGVDPARAVGRLGSSVAIPLVQGPVRR